MDSGEQIDILNLKDEKIIPSMFGWEIVFRSLILLDWNLEAGLSSFRVGKIFNDANLSYLFPCIICLVVH